MKRNQNMGEKGVVLKFTNPRHVLTRTVGHNSKSASKIYLPADWEGEDVVVIRK